MWVRTTGCDLCLVFLEQPECDGMSLLNSGQAVEANRAFSRDSMIPHWNRQQIKRRREKVNKKRLCSGWTAGMARGLCLLLSPASFQQVLSPSAIDSFVKTVTRVRDESKQWLMRAGCLSVSCLWGHQRRSSGSFFDLTFNSGLDKLTKDANSLALKKLVKFISSGFPLKLRLEVLLITFLHDGCLLTFTVSRFFLFIVQFVHY